MNKYKVTYYYLASGMGGKADREDYGIIEAESEDEAREIALKNKHPIDEMYGPDNSYSTWDFIRGCLTAELITDLN